MTEQEKLSAEFCWASSDIRYADSCRMSVDVQQNHALLVLGTQPGTQPTSLELSNNASTPRSDDQALMSAVKTRTGLAWTYTVHAKTTYYARFLNNSKKMQVTYFSSIFRPKRTARIPTEPRGDPFFRHQCSPEKKQAHSLQKWGFFGKSMSGRGSLIYDVASCKPRNV